MVGITQISCVAAFPLWPFKKDWCGKETLKQREIFYVYLRNHLRFENLSKIRFSVKVDF